MMHTLTIGPRQYAQFERLRHAAGLVHVFSTRPMDVSLQRGEGARDRAQMALDLELNPDVLYCCEQVHRTRLHIVADADSDVQDPDTAPSEAPGSGRLLPACDGALTRRIGAGLMTFSADCPLILVFDARRRALGVAHASWRCTTSRIAERLVEHLHETFRCDPDDMVAGIGPGAGPCCYEVREDVYAAAQSLPDRSRCIIRRNGRMYFDLWRANEDQLVRAGLRADGIETAGVCTICQGEAFYSFRREGTGCGRFGLLAALV